MSTATSAGFLVSTEFNHGVTLASFQERAAREVLTAIRLPSDPLPTQIVLTAPTGSGKTYIAGAIMRSLIPKPPEAPACSIIWASYDPQLNVRSNADFLGVFGMNCNQISARNPTIALGLNILDLSKLGAGTKLGTPSEDNSSIPFFERVMSPDNGGRPLYLFVDEAHIGSKQRGSGDQTIVAQLVDAMRRRSAITTANSAIIAVTATPDRVLTGLFKGPSTRVKVLREDVVASGVIKRSVAIPDPRTSIGVGFRSIDVDIAYKKLLEYQCAWDRYAADPTTSMTTAAPVRPLLMVQIPGEKKASTEGPNTPKEWIDSIVAALATCSTSDSHSLTFGYCMSTLAGDQDVDTPGGRVRVQQIAAADINKSPINVVFFINGLETGWDCPRAEVLLSFVARTDATTITQILGRVLRNPARPDRLTDAGYEDLDRSFLCVPYYDRDAISDIIKAMEQDASGELTIAVDVHPTQTGVAPAVVTEVLEILTAIPTDVIENGQTLGAGWTNRRTDKGIRHGTFPKAWRARQRRSSAIRGPTAVYRR
jgi:type III restriction enzyme